MFDACFPQFEQPSNDEKIYSEHTRYKRCTICAVSCLWHVLSGGGEYPCPDPVGGGGGYPLLVPSGVHCPGPVWGGAGGTLS